jgi:hypothetical protein
MDMTTHLLANLRNGRLLLHNLLKRFKTLVGLFLAKPLPKMLTHKRQFPLVNVPISFDDDGRQDEQTCVEVLFRTIF